MKENELYAVVSAITQYIEEADKIYTETKFDFQKDTLSLTGDSIKKQGLITNRHITNLK